MLLRVIGSGSTGNCYILDNGNEALLLDLGCKPDEVKKALDFNISKVVGAVVSHGHTDHAKYIKGFEKMGIEVFCPWKSDKPKRKKYLGNFTIKIFDLVHSVTNYGFLIEHNDLGRMLYITDTEYVKYRFHNINTFLIEANYKDDYVEHTEGNYEHVMRGHMNIETTSAFLNVNRDISTKYIILCHLSATHGNATEFKQRIKDEQAGCIVEVAEKGLSMDISKIPFM